MKPVTTWQWVRFWFWVGLVSIGGFFALPVLVASWKQPTAMFWALVVGGVLAIKVLCSELKRIGAFPSVLEILGGNRPATD